MAAPNDLETNVPIGNEGDSSPESVAVFTEALKLATASAIDLTAGLVVPPDPPGDSAYVRAKAGTNSHSYGLGVDSGLPGSILLYTHGMGMEIDEWVSWFFNYGGDAVVDALLLAADAANPYFLPVLTRGAEGAGWFKEAVTLKKFEEGLWSDGSQIALRQFGEGKPAMNHAFDAISTPTPTTGISFLNDVFGGKFNGGEYNEPFGDAAVINGLFPNWPSGQGGIVEAGMKHYYMSGWHTPARVRNVWINRTIWDALSADDKLRYKYAAMASCLENIGIGYNGQDAIVANFQAVGCQIHRRLPQNVILRLRDGLSVVQDEGADADGTGAYRTLLDSQRNFIKANHQRWSASTEDRRMRFERTKYAAEFTPNS